MATSHNLPGSRGNKRNATTHKIVYQAILTTPCSDHGAHTIILSGLDDFAQHTARWICERLQDHGTTAVVSEHTSHNPASDINTRDVDYDALCAELARLLDDETVKPANGQGADDEGVAF